jgi:hypothetical protein
VLSSSSSLRELQLESTVLKDEALQQLGSLLATYNRLKVLNLSRNSDVSSTGWCQFFSQLKKSQLEEMWLTHNKSFMPALSNWLSSCETLRVLKVSSSESISIEDWQSFASIMESHPSIEEIDISHNENVVAELFANVIAVNSRLKRICLSACDIVQLQMIASALEIPSCSLEELDFHYSDDHSDIQQGDGMTQIFVDALQRNSTLKILRKKNSGETVFKLVKFLNLLCNKSSIDATYNSNHSLQVLSQWHSSIMIPMELYSLLHANRDTNKQAVAQKKIIANHSFEHVNFVQSTLPLILSLVGNAGFEKGLSKVYGILRRVPHVIEKRTHSVM